MAAKDRYSVKIECPQCGEKGKLHLSENDYPFMRRLDREVEKIEGNFSGHMKGEVDTEILCKSCEHKFVI